MSDWIYCSEKLPPYGKRVILSIDGKEWQGEEVNLGPHVIVGYRHFTDEVGEHYQGEGIPVTGIYAWMPFPEPAVLP